MKHPNDHYYFIELQYLGFRYHGWQRQPQVKTVQEMVEKTINYVLQGAPFKILSAGRTDAMVSVWSTGIQLIVRDPLDKPVFLDDLNSNFPADIRALSIKEVPDNFNIIQDVLTKEYRYYFCFGEKMHPFAAPYMAYIKDDLAIEEMQKAASLFTGMHNFEGFCEHNGADKSFVRTVDECEIIPNSTFVGGFFPANSYCMRIVGNGFLRYQVRYIMGALFQIGAKTIQPDDLRIALKEGTSIASKSPASGLHLFQVSFK